jgi:PAS domain S-box-containing protein
MVGTVLDIEARKAAQEELSRSQAQIQALLENTSDIIWSVDASNFALRTFNRAFDDLLMAGMGRHARVGMVPEELGPPERAALWRQYYSTVLQQGTVDCDFQLFSQPRSVHLTLRSLIRDGQAFGISAFAHDITERKRMEEALRKSEEKFAKAFAQSPMPFTLTSARDHRYLEVNKAFENATGYSRVEVLGRTPFELGIWVKPAQRYELVQALHETGYLSNVELQYRTKQGHIRDALGSGALIEINGEPCMLAVIADVTDRKMAEKALQDSEERLRLAVESRRMYAFEWDRDTDIVMRSSESRRILNLANDKTEHKKQELLECIHPEDRETYLKAINSPTIESPSYKIVFRLMRGSQGVTFLEESGRAFFDDTGKVRRVIGMVADITEARQSERALRELSGRLITSQEEERRRVARELHDNIGQELALLSVQAQRLDSGASEEESTLHTDVHDLYRRIKDIAQKVSNLSHRLHSSELEFLGLSIAVERLCRDFSTQYGVEIDYGVKGIPKHMEGGSALAVYRVIQEALQNVAKHSKATLVELVLVCQNGELLLTIQDNGEGFVMQAATEGSGLGLVSMRERMRLIGGSFHITSTPGHGTKIQASVAVQQDAPPQYPPRH